MKEIIGNYEVKLNGTQITINKGGQMIKAIEAPVWEAIEVYNKVVATAKKLSK